MPEVPGPVKVPARGARGFAPARTVGGAYRQAPAMARRRMTSVTMSCEGRGAGMLLPASPHRRSASFAAWIA